MVKRAADQSTGTYEIYPVRTFLGQKRWRWRFEGHNHEIVASGEAYNSQAGAEHAIELLKGSANARVVTLYPARSTR